MLGFIRDYLHEYRRSPLVREIQIGCGIASYKSAIDRLNALERKGYIKRAPHKHRGIRIAKRSLQTVQAGGEEAPLVPQRAAQEEAPLEGALG